MLTYHCFMPKSIGKITVLQRVITIIYWGFQLLMIKNSELDAVLMAGKFDL